MAIGSKNQGSPAKGLKVKRQENGQPNVFQEPVFRLAVNLSLDGIILTNLDGFISYVNEAVLKIYGSDDKNDLLGKHVLDFLAEKDRQKAMRISIECLTTGEGKFDEFTVLTKKGFEVPVEITKAIIKMNLAKESGSSTSLETYLNERKLKRG
ncbi:MAG: PAS domain S-box protein [Candidatus Bathyarchaeota archaeon]|nr:PAS domain S-box protein [Candidatus Bathyarchaeota archaeon]